MAHALSLSDDGLPSVAKQRFVVDSVSASAMQSSRGGCTLPSDSCRLTVLHESLLLWYKSNGKVQPQRGQLEGWR